MGYYETHRDAIDYFREEYDFLSNFYPTKVVFDGITFGGRLSSTEMSASRRPASVCPPVLR